MKTRVMIKNLGLGLATIFLMMLSVTGYSQACSGNMVTVSLQNFSQTTNTVEFDVYLANTSATNTMMLSTASINVLHNANMLPVGATGTSSVVLQPSACDFPGYPAGSAEAYNADARNIRFIGIPNSSPTVALTSTPKRFCRMRLTSTLPWTSLFAAQFTINPTNLSNPTRFASQVQVYCNGNPNSTTLTTGTSTLTLGGPYSYTLNPCTNTASTQTVNACGSSYTWSANGTTYTQAGTYTSVTNVGSCTDTKTLVLTLNNDTSSSQSVTACDSYTWSVNGQTYTTSGTYTSTSTNASGCTDTKTLVLTINNSTSSSQSVTACDSYTWSVNGQTYTTSGTRTFTGTNAANCPDTKTLVLTINNSTSSSQSVTACGSYTWSANGQTYTTSGTYTATGTNAAGCPDTKTLVLTINSTSSEETQVACDSYTWNGTTYTTSGDYNAIYTNPTTGCTIEAVLHLTIGSTSSTESQSACGSYTWSANGQTYTASGTYTQVTTLSNGCTDTKTLVLTIRGISTQPVSPQLCTTTGSTTTVSVATQNTTVTGYVWQFLPPATTTVPNPSWTTITAANAGVVYSNFTTATLGIAKTSALPAAGTQYRALINTVECGQLTSNVAPLIINPLPIAKAITGNTPNVCQGFNRTLTLATGSVGTIQWQFNVTNSTTAPLVTDSNWADLGSSIAPTSSLNGVVTLPLTNLQATAWYRVKFTSGTCSNVVYSAAVRLGVDPTPTVGTVSPDSTTICNGTGTTLSLSSAQGAIKWFKSTNYTSSAPTWGAITNTTTSLSTGNLTVTTWYIVEVSSGVCSKAISNVVVVNVIPKPVSKAISGNRGNVCFGGSRDLVLASGSKGTIQWQQNVTSSTTAPAVGDSNWSDLLDPIAPVDVAALNPSYTLPLTNIQATAWYRVKFTNGPCTEIYSAAVRLGVDPTAVVGTVSPSESTVCNGSGTTLTLSAGQVGTVKWFKSTNFGSLGASATWAGITNSTNTLATGNLTATTWFRVEVTSGVCSKAISNVVVVNVTPKPVSKAITANTTTPTGASSSLALCSDLRTAKTFTIGAGYLGNIQWQTVASNVAPTATTVWTDIVGATNETYTVGQNGFVPAIGGNYFRVKFSNGSCTDVFSAALVVWYKDCSTVRDVTPETVTVTPTNIDTPELTKFDVKAYPNPYAETFNLSLTTSSEDKVSVVVYDMTGRLIERRDVRPSDMVEQQIGDRYPSGVYNVVVTQGEEVKTLRVIKR